MSNPDQARETQRKNIQAKTGKSLAEIRAIIAKSGLGKHGEIRQMLMDQFSLGYGDANALVHFARQSDGPSAAAAAGDSPADILSTIYAGPKALLRPIHEQLMAAIEKFGPFEIAQERIR